MNQLFELSKTEKKLLMVYPRGDDMFWLGYVLRHTSEIVELQHFSHLGQPDGIVVEKIDNIERVEFSNDYVRAFNHLISNYQAMETQTIHQLEEHVLDDWNVSILKQFIGTQKLVTIQINGNTEMGFPKEVTDEFLVWHSVGKLGEDYGLVCFRIDGVSSIQADTFRNRKAELLYRWRKENQKQKQE
jgi:hypothetical protein